MVRVDFKAIFGISFSKNLDIFAISKAIQTAIPYVEHISPQLFKFLNTTLKTIDHLMVFNEIIQTTGEKVQELEVQVIEGEEALKKATTALAQSNQQITTTIGSMGGSQPPFPTAGVVLGPLSAGVQAAEQALDQLKEQLKEQKSILIESTYKYQEELNQLTASIERKVKESDLAEKIDTSIPQHIYR